MLDLTGSVWNNYMFNFLQLISNSKVVEDYIALSVGVAQDFFFYQGWDHPGSYAIEAALP